MKISKNQLRQLIKEHMMMLPLSEMKPINNNVSFKKEARNKENREGHNLDREERFQEKLANDPKFKAKYEAEKDPWKKQAMKNKLKEQVASSQVPPSSNVEEAVNPRFTGIDNIVQLEAYGIDIETLLVQLDKAANNYFLNSWGDYDEEQIKMMLDDLKIMAYVRKYLQEGKIEKALSIYRKADTMLRDAFPPLMWKLSNNQYEDLKAKGKIKKL